MTTKEIVNQYLKQLGFENNIHTLSDITKLIQAHEQTLAFSSMKVLLKDEISLELKDIYKSLVVQKRGGYCFEHNKLFYEVLKELGFDVEFYLARVVNNTQNEVPQTHRFTLLHYQNERYVIDVGVGFRSPRVPVKFTKQNTKSHLDISYSIKEYEDKTFGLQLIQNNSGFRVTKFDLNPCYEADFEMGHFYSHKHPCASFVNYLVVSTITSDAIHSLRNSDYLIIRKDKQEEIKIENLEQFDSILKNDLNCTFEEDEIKFIYEHYIKENP